MSRHIYVRTLKLQLAKLNARIDRLIIARKGYVDLAREHARIRSLLANQA